MSLATGITSTFAEFDPFDVDYIDDPYPMISRIHKEMPVFFYPPLDLWFISKYDDVKNAIKDWETFSSRALGLVTPPADIVERAPDLTVDELILATDPPLHTYLRQPIIKSFSHSAIKELEPKLRIKVNALIDTFIERGHCDIMREFAYPISLFAMMTLFEMPPEREEDFRHWGDDIISMFTVKRLGDDSADPVHPMPEPEVRMRWERLCEANSFFRTFLDAQRNATGAPFIKHMLNAKNAQGEPALSSGAMIRNLMAVVAGGHDTTANLIGQVALLLARNPDQWDRLNLQPELLPNAIEETLRRHGSAQGLLRVTTRDVEVRDVLLPKGSLVYLMLGGAAHDEDVFDAPWQFDIGRHNAGDNLTFGLGRHSCLGNTIAKLEARIAFEELLGRMPRFQIVPNGIEASPALTAVNLAQLNVAWSKSA